MGVFDALIISNSTGILLVSIERSAPLETGRFDVQGNWVPAGTDDNVHVDGFGVDASNGQPYFDTDGPTPGEAAELYLNATTGGVWLQ